MRTHAERVASSRSVLVAFEGRFKSIEKYKYTQRPSLGGGRPAGSHKVVYAGAAARETLLFRLGSPPPSRPERTRVVL